MVNFYNIKMNLGRNLNELNTINDKFSPCLIDVIHLDSKDFPNQCNVESEHSIETLLSTGLFSEVVKLEGVK